MTMTIFSQVMKPDAYAAIIQRAEEQEWAIWDVRDAHETMGHVNKEGTHRWFEAQTPHYLEACFLSLENSQAKHRELILAQDRPVMLVASTEKKLVRYVAYVESLGFSVWTNNMRRQFDDMPLFDNYAEELPWGL